MYVIAVGILEVHPKGWGVEGYCRHNRVKIIIEKM
jgi:hypothetical protein